MFYIGFTTTPQTDDDGWLHALGGIELGSESDGFAADLRCWTMRDYEAQWRQGVARLAAGHLSSALVTSYAGPDGAVHSMRPMWRIGQTVFVQERILPGAGISESAGAEGFYDLVGERRTATDDGKPISEWSLPFAEMLAFLASA